MQANGTIRVAIQKSGRLFEGSFSLLRQMGLQFEAYQDRLFTQCRNLPIDVLFLRDNDIPEYVRDGVADLGIVGSNVVAEQGVAIELLLALDWLLLAVPGRSRARRLHRPRRAVRQADRHILSRDPRRYLSQHRIEAEIVLLKGSVEVAPTLRIADAICDLVSPGARRPPRPDRAGHGPRCKRRWLRGKTRRLKKALIERLLLRARGVQEPASTDTSCSISPPGVASVQRLLPGCRARRVVPLAEPGYVAVHSMCSKRRFGRRGRDPRLRRHGYYRHAGQKVLR